MAGVLKAKVGAAWVPVGSALDAKRIHWNAAWGVISKVEGSGIISLTTTPVTFYTTTVLLAAGRRYSVSLATRATDMAVAGSIIVELFLDGVGLAGPADHYNSTMPVSHYGGGAESRWLLEGDGLTHSISVKGRTSTGIGGWHGQSGPSTYFVVEDIGPITRVPEGTEPPPLSVWTPLALKSTWTQKAGYEPASFCKIQDRVLVRGSVNFGAGGSNPMATLPSGYRPAWVVRRYSSWTRTSDSAILPIATEVQLNGDIGISGLSAAGHHDCYVEFYV